MAIGQFEYRAPGSLTEAVSLLDARRGGTKVLAGGTDLIVQMKQGQTRPELIVDVKRIPELNRLEWRDGAGLHIGAAVPLSRLITFDPLLDKFGVLAHACSLIGSIQIRNRATMGGNVCNAAPSADTAPALLCLGARAVVASAKGTRIIPLEAFFLGPAQTALDRNELLVAVEIPTPPISSAGCYLRHTPREEMDIAVAGVASFLVSDSKGKTLKDARIALAAVAPAPKRAQQAEAILIGKVPTRGMIEEAAERVSDAAAAISDMRASAEYRRALVKVLTRRTLEKACEALDIGL